MSWLVVAVGSLLLAADFLEGFAERRRTRSERVLGEKYARLEEVQRVLEEELALSRALDVSRLLQKMRVRPVDERHRWN